MVGRALGACCSCSTATRATRPWPAGTPQRPGCSWLRSRAPYCQLPNTQAPISKQTLISHMRSPPPNSRGLVTHINTREAHHRGAHKIIFQGQFRQFRQFHHKNHSKNYPAFFFLGSAPRRLLRWPPGGDPLADFLSGQGDRGPAGIDSFFFGRFLAVSPPLMTPPGACNWEQAISIFIKICFEVTIWVHFCAFFRILFSDCIG